jgi:hypothetical protein
MSTDLDPRLRGGDNTADFHPLGWAARPWTLKMTDYDTRRVHSARVQLQQIRMGSPLTPCFSR